VISQSKNDIDLRHNLSKLAGFLYEDESSKSKITSFISTYAIDMEKFKIESWNNLNEFLKRNLVYKPNMKKNNILYSPVEGLLKVITEDNFYVKGFKFDFISLVQKKIHFNHSILFRMIPSDYHKVHCPYKLKFISMKYIKGDLYSIRPNTIVENNSLIKNERCVLTFTDKDDYTVYMILVGSIFIGSVKIYKEKINSWVNPGDEIGYFKFGGSSVVLLLEKDISYKVNTFSDFETKVELGTIIGSLEKTKKILHNYDNTIKLPDTTKDQHIKLFLEISIYLFLYFYYKKFLSK
jgi:phosphatidylserine decarboxylase